MDAQDYLGTLVAEVYSDMEDIVGKGNMPEWLDYEGICVNSRLTRVYARCIRRQMTYGPPAYRFEVSPNFMRMNYMTQRNILAHEWIHVMCDLHEHHGKKFKYWMDYFNQLGDFNITVRGDIPVDQYDKAPIKARYVLKCQKCGIEYSRNRMCDFVRRPELYTHRGCGGHFIRV